MMVFAPKEEVLNDRTLFMIRRGVCAMEGKVLVSGGIWGEDFLLANPNLRGRSKVRALNYLEVLMLSIHDLLPVVASFPEARAWLRWAQVRIAVMRAIRLIAKTVSSLESSGQLGIANELTKHQYQ